MENSEQTKNKSSSVIIIIIIAVIVAAVIWNYLGKIRPEPVTVEVNEKISEVVAEIPKPVEPELKQPEIEAPAEEEVIEIVEDVVEVIPLPLLDESDSWLQEKLSAMTWRKELLKMVIDEDMIRRFVVFTDNFSQGNLAYEHSPVILPKTTFSTLEEKKLDEQNQEVWLWDEKSTRRFSTYVDLLRSFDSETLVNWYIELKPLIDQAYSELGYPDDDFTDTLQDSITRVLD